MADGAPNFDALVSQAMASATPQTGDIQGILRQVKGVSAEEAKETSDALKEMSDTAKEDKAEAKKHLKAAEDYEKQIGPWTQQRPEPDPISAFGSLGSVFGILASAFTHQPMMNAMNAAAAGINAIRENDLAKYQDAFTAFKENTSILQKRADQENKEYEEARALMQTDMALGTAKLQAVVAKYGHQLDALNIQRGLYDDIFSRNDKAFDIATQLGPKIAEMIEGGNLAQAGMALKNAKLSKDPDTIAKAQKDYNDALQHYADFKSQLAGFKPGTVSDPMQVTVQDPDGKQHQVMAMFDKARGVFLSLEDGKPLGNVVNASKLSTTASQAQPYSEQQLDTYGSQRASGMPLNQIVTGYGRAAGDKRDQINAKATDIIKSEHPEWPKEQADKLAGQELANRTIEFQAGKTSVSQLTTMRGATVQAVNQLDYNIEKAKEEMKKLPSSDLSPIINAIARGEEKWTGDPAYSGLYFYMNAVATESARILSGGQASRAQLHVGAMEEAQKWANINMTPASFDEVAAAMHGEGQYRVKTFDDAIDYQKTRMGGGKSSQTSPPGAAGPQEGDKGTSKSGKAMTFRNGHWEYD